MGFSTGYQSPHFIEVPWIRQGAVCLASLLLVPYQWRYPVPAWLPPPSPRDCSLYSEETSTQGDQAKSFCCSPCWRWQGRGWQSCLQKSSWCWGDWQGRSCWSWICTHGVQRRVWQGQACSVIICLLSIFSDQNKTLKTSTCVVITIL